MTGLILHRGAEVVTRDQVAAVPLPAATKTWHPIPHLELVDMVAGTLAVNGLQVVRETFGMARNGARFFATLDLRNGVNQPDYGLTIGIRNSHDQSFPAAGVIGSRVFVCDNLAFSGEVKFSRKHTSRIMDALPGVTTRAVARLIELRGHQDRRIAAYKGYHFSSDRDPLVADVILRALEVEALPQPMLNPLLREWRNPTHVEFREPNAWSLFNCFTQVLKDSSPMMLPRRTQALHGVMDLVCRVDEVPDAEVIATN
jgi:hypothetical protein